VSGKHSVAGPILNGAVLAFHSHVVGILTSGRSLGPGLGSGNLRMQVQPPSNRRTIASDTDSCHPMSAKSHVAKRFRKTGSEMR